MATTSVLPYCHGGNTLAMPELIQYYVHNVSIKMVGCNTKIGPENSNATKKFTISMTMETYEALKLASLGTGVKKTRIIENVLRKAPYIDKCINIVRDDGNYIKETGHDVFIGKSRGKK